MYQTEVGDIPNGAKVGRRAMDHPKGHDLRRSLPKDEIQELATHGRTVGVAAQGGCVSARVCECVSV